MGHSDIAPLRKKDPGEKFPWKELSKKKLCIWHNLNENKIKIYRNTRLSLSNENIFLKNLCKIGFCKIKNINQNLNKKYIVEAFQRRFRQTLVNGKIDLECLLISKNLLKS